MCEVVIMLKEKASQYYQQENRNCAEAILLAANDVWQLGLSADSARLIGGFGGGMGCGSTCGALAGAIAVLGVMDPAKKAHESETLKADCAALTALFNQKLGSTLCDDLTAKYRTEQDRCLATVQLAAQVLEEFVQAKKAPVSKNGEMPTAEQIKEVKALGFLHCKGTDKFNARIITRNGKITAPEAQAILSAAQLYGNGEIAFTTRLTVEVQQVSYKNIEAFRAEVGKAGLMTGGTGSKVRPVVSCKGTTCQYGLLDSFALSDEIHRRFFLGYNDVKLPHKFKIAVGGCPNNCVKPDLNDLGIVGQRVPILDKDLCRGCKKCQVQLACPIHSSSVQDGKLVFGEDCNHCGRCIGKCPFGAVADGTYGYKVYIGGRWGKKTAHGTPLSKIFTDEKEILDVVEKAILLFREQGLTGERFADTIARLGFENVQSQLLANDLLDRKTEILGAQVHLVGGATC